VSPSLRGQLVDQERIRYRRWSSLANTSVSNYIRMLSHYWGGRKHNPITSNGAPLGDAARSETTPEKKAS